MCTGVAKALPQRSTSPRNYAHPILQALLPGTGVVLDLGGGTGELRQPLRERGYHSYVNLDIQRFENGEPSLVGDAHQLPFKDAVFDMVVSKDNLHLFEPWVVVKEVHRVLKVGGLFVIWVPFMYPFHGDDLYRYSSLGLQRLLRDFEVVTFESPSWVFTVIGLMAIEALKRMHLGFTERPIKRLCSALDRLFLRNQQRLVSFAAAYRVVARKRDKTKQ